MPVTPPTRTPGSLGSVKTDAQPTSDELTELLADQYNEAADKLIEVIDQSNTNETSIAANASAVGTNTTNIGTNASALINKDGSVPFAGGYTPVADQDPATKKYVDDNGGGGGGGGGSGILITQTKADSLSAIFDFDLSAIPADHDLHLSYKVRSTNATNASAVLRFDSDAGPNYTSNGFTMDVSGTSQNGDNSAAASYITLGQSVDTDGVAGRWAWGRILIPDPKDATRNTVAWGKNWNERLNNAATQVLVSGSHEVVGAVGTLQVELDTGGNFLAGSTVSIFAVPKDTLGGAAAVSSVRVNGDGVLSTLSVPTATLSTPADLEIIYHLKKTGLSSGGLVLTINGVVAVDYNSVLAVNSSATGLASVPDELGNDIPLGTIGNGLPSDGFADGVLTIADYTDATKPPRVQGQGTYSPGGANGITGYQLAGTTLNAAAVASVQFTSDGPFDTDSYVIIRATPRPA